MSGRRSGTSRGRRPGDLITCGHCAACETEIFSAARPPTRTRDGEKPWGTWAGEETSVATALESVAGTVILHRPLDLCLEMACCAEGPVRVAEELAGQQHEVGLAALEDLFGLLRLRN